MRSRWLLRFGMDWRIYLVYEFPDRNTITVTPNNSVAWGCCFSHVSLAKKRADPRHSFLERHESDVYTRKEVYVNVVLSSGTAMFREIVERMTNELTALALFTMKIRGLLRPRMDWRTYLVFPQVSSEQLSFFFGLCCLALSS